MNEIAKYLYIPSEVLIKEPSVTNGSASLVVEGDNNETLGASEINSLKNQFAGDMEEVAPDLKSHDLAKHYADTLFSKLIGNGSQTLNQISEAGVQEFHYLGRNVLGPLAVCFVDTVLKSCGGKAIFPARDATPFFYIAKTLKTLQPNVYPVNIEDIANPVFNRKLWGIEDEQDPENEVLPITNPLVQKLLFQMGFFSDQPKSFIEVGCWGSMVDQLKREMPNEDYSVHFLFTHLPDYIYGFTNIHGEGLSESVLETVADTWEASPKFFKRPSKLVEEGGIVKASLEGKMINSPLLPAWTVAALQGAVDAAKDFVVRRQAIDPRRELLKLWELSQRAQAGEFTGVLPGHTETWSEGEQWKANWKWGKIPPFK